MEKFRAISSLLCIVYTSYWARRECNKKGSRAVCSLVSREFHIPRIDTNNILRRRRRRCTLSATAFFPSLLFPQFLLLSAKYLKDRTQIGSPGLRILHRNRNVIQDVLQFNEEEKHPKKSGLCHLLFMSGSWFLMA